MEFDTGSSNFIFMQSTNYLTNNGTQSCREANYDKEYSDDAQDRDKHLNKGAGTAFRKYKAESEGISQEDFAAEKSWKVKEEKDGNHDVVAESMMKFRSVHEALEREVQNLRDVGKEDPLFSDDLIQPSESDNQQGYEPRFFEEFQIGGDRQSYSSNAETQMTKSKQKVAHVQSKLKDAQVMLKVREAKVFELESTLDQGDMKSKLEEALKQRTEALVEYLVISETIENLRAEPLDQIKLMVEQKKLASEQVEVMDKLVGAEMRATELKAQADKLEMRCEEILASEEVWKLQNRICRLSSCFTVQLVLLLLAVCLFVLQFSSCNMEVLPT